MREATVLAEQRGHLGCLILNRPSELNALSPEMIARLHHALQRWWEHKEIRAIVLYSSSDKAFCCGGDIRALYDSHQAGEGLHERYFRDEFALDRLLYQYPKPILALLDGYVLGGGMGLAQGSTFRAVSERVRMAMPETAIGYFPDVGASYFLSHLPHKVGFYMGLTGNQIGAADALALGLADRYLPRRRFGELISRLEQLPLDNAAGTIERLLEELGAAELAGPELTELYPAIEAHFGQDSVDAIRASLAREERHAYKAWAQTTLATIESRCPLSVYVTFEELRRGSCLSRQNCFDMELHLIGQWFEKGNLIEGVRALLVDRDKQPRWQPKTFDAVSQEQVAALFANFQPATR